MDLNEIEEPKTNTNIVSNLPPPPKINALSPAAIDMLSLIEIFSMKNDLSFSCFKEIWKIKNFQLIHKSNKLEFNQHEMFNALTSIPLVLFCRIRDDKKRIGLIYMIYTLYNTQITIKDKKEKINITICIWKEITEFFESKIKNNVQLKDAWLILSKLKNENCFKLVANINPYPGIKNPNVHNIVGLNESHPSEYIDYNDSISSTIDHSELNRLHEEYMLSKRELTEKDNMGFYNIGIFEEGLVSREPMGINEIKDDSLLKDLKRIDSDFEEKRDRLTYVESRATFDPSLYAQTLRNKRPRKNPKKSTAPKKVPVKKRVKQDK